MADPPSEKPKPERKSKPTRVPGTVRRELNIPQSIDDHIAHVSDTKKYSYNAVAVKMLQDQSERGPIINQLGKINEHQSLQMHGILRSSEQVAEVAAEQQAQGERLTRVENMLESMQKQLNRMEERQTNGPPQD